MSTDPVLYIHTDGASRGNPGEAAYAYVIELPDGQVIEDAGKIGTKTNNQAEYTALIRALEHALELGPHYQVVVNTDSDLLVNQMNGRFAVKKEGLRDLVAEAQELRRKFDGGVTIQHVRRERNKRADALCNEVLDGKRLGSVRNVVARQQAAPERAVKPSLEHEARQVLDAAARAWREGKADPSVEAVWRDLAHIFKRHQIRTVARAQHGGAGPA
jgi:ribonuclease HI